MNKKACICGKTKPFADCCGRFLSGAATPKTPEQLMRSRYAAYALGGYGEYLMSTWLPISVYGLSSAELSEKTLDWQRLEVIASSQQGDKGVVEFKAWYRRAPNLDDLDFMHEASDFVRIKSQWFYVGAQMQQ